MRKIGKMQLAFLEELLKHNVWVPNGQWSFNSRKVVERIVTGLERLELQTPISTFWTENNQGKRELQRVERDDGLFLFILNQRELHR